MTAAKMKTFRVGDRVRINRGDCTYWSHDSVWCQDGKTGRVDGTWRGHPGGDGEHHVAVNFFDGNQFVASLTFAESELTVIRRGTGPQLSMEVA